MQSLIESGQLEQLMGVFIGICAVLMPVAIVFVVLYFRHRRSVEMLATVRYLADKGLPVPAELLPQSSDARRCSDSRSSLVSASAYVGAGISLMIFFYAWTPMRFLWGVGALFALVGLAQMIALWLTRKSALDNAGSGAG